LLKQINDFLGPILIVVFIIIACATPLIILVFSILNLVRGKSHWVIIVLKAIASFLVWTVLTYAVVLIFMMFVVSAKHPTTTADEIKTTGIFIGECVLYSLAGVGMILWVRRAGKSRSD
jgi:O-antigen/teichoic acid export membrane protein